MASKPAPSSHELQRQWNQAPVTRIYQWKNKMREGWGKWMMQRLHEEWLPGNVAPRTWSLSTNEGDGYENVTQKNEFALLQTLRLFHLVQFVKCCQFLLEINSWRLHRKSGKEKQIHYLVFIFSRSPLKVYLHGHFHGVVAVQRRQRNVQKSVMYVQSRCFANVNLLLFCRLRCLSYLLGTLRSNDADGKKNVKKTNRFYKQNNNFARASRFFVHFFACFCTTTTEKCLI